MSSQPVSRALPAAHPGKHMLFLTSIPVKDRKKQGRRDFFRVGFTIFLRSRRLSSAHGKTKNGQPLGRKEEVRRNVLGEKVDWEVLNAGFVVCMLQVWGVGEDQRSERIYSNVEGYYIYQYSALYVIIAIYLKASDFFIRYTRP